MIGKPSPVRFMIRRAATDGFVVWDRESEGPAMFNGHPAVGLTEAQAAEIKSHLVKSQSESRMPEIGTSGRTVSLRKTPWTDEENERLRQLATSGVSIFRAAATLKRKTGSIRTQARKIGCPFPTIKEMRLKSSLSPDGQR
jgi:hypothetical protein